MKTSLLDTVVLSIDLPEHGLRCGDVGTVVEVYELDGVEVEFVTGSGRTQALVTLSMSDVRPMADGEILSDRSVAAAKMEKKRIECAVLYSARQTSHYRETAYFEKLGVIVSLRGGVFESNFERNIWIIRVSKPSARLRNNFASEEKLWQNS
jgi:hypothetical protein